MAQFMHSARGCRVKYSKSHISRALVFTNFLHGQSTTTCRNSFCHDSSPRLLQSPGERSTIPAYRLSIRSARRLLQSSKDNVNNQRLSTTSPWSVPWHSSPVMTPEQTTVALQQNAVSVYFDEEPSPKKSGVLQRFDSNQLFSNKPGEDRRAVAECLHTDGMMFGVFDGHGGTACAQAVSERLFDYIAAEMLPFHMLPQVLQQLKKRELQSLVKWCRHPNDYKLQLTSDLYHDSLIRYVQANLSVDVYDDNTTPDVLKTAFDRLDKDLSTEAMCATTEELGIEPILNAVAGSCACVAYLEDRDLYVGNVGDCRAVLGRNLGNGQWEAVQLSVDHNAQNSSEVGRIKSVHPPNESTTVIKNGRLLAELIPLRAFGNIRFKWTTEMQQRLLRSAIGYVMPKNYHTPPYLISTPEVMHHQLTRDDKFLILASDGLWDMLTCEKAVQLVGEHMKSMKASMPYFPSPSQKLGDIMRDLKERMDILKSLDTNSATHLIRYALCGVNNGFDLNRLAEILSLPDATARQHRDDMTVTVIYFNS